MNTTELKALAEKVRAWGLTAVMQTEGDEFAGIAAVGAIDEDGEFYEVAVIDTDKYTDCCAAKKIADFYAAANPAAILELIADRDSWEQQASDRTDDAVRFATQLEDAQGEIRALRETEQNMRERVKALEEGLRFYADPGDYKAPFTGGLGKLYFDCGLAARALLEQKP